MVVEFVQLARGRETPQVKRRREVKEFKPLVGVAATSSIQFAFGACFSITVGPESTVGPFSVYTHLRQFTFWLKVGLPLGFCNTHLHSIFSRSFIKRGMGHTVGRCPMQGYSLVRFVRSLYFTLGLLDFSI